MSKNMFLHITLIFIGVIALSACSRQQPQISAAEMGGPGKAVSVLHPTAGNKVTGTVTFQKYGENIRVLADVSGLTPGKHGFHIHEFGDCSAADGTSAGGHFNPDGTRHGGPAVAERHVGDLGNLEADTVGNAHYEWTDSLIKFSGPHSIIGRAVIVHAGKDDLASQPTGAAGGRVACGVIGFAK
jgi:Cu-Zn family superoxide dismutase